MNEKGHNNVSPSKEGALFLPCRPDKSRPILEDLASEVGAQMLQRIARFVTFVNQFHAQRTYKYCQQSKYLFLKETSLNILALGFILGLRDRYLQASRASQTHEIKKYCANAKTTKTVLKSFTELNLFY